MFKKRGIYLHLSKICLGLLFLCFLSTSSFARQIALFYDPVYVDINDGNVFAEASNLKASLELLGHEVMFYTDFGSIIGADFDLVIIPELENLDISQNLSTDQFKDYENYVRNGGSIIIMGVVSGIEFQSDNAIKFINEIKGSQMRVGSPVLAGKCIKDRNLPIGEFEDAPNEIDNNNAVVYIQQGIPNDAQVLYHNQANPSEAAVAKFKVGDGSIMYFGWGWWNAVPYGSQDGGWISLLKLAIEALACDEPELVLEDDYQFSLELNGKLTLDKEDFANQYLACTDVEMSISPSEFSCEDIGKELQVEVSVKDKLERVVTKTTAVFIEDFHEVCDLQALQLQLTGFIHSVNGKPLKDVEVTLEAEFPMYLLSDENGSINSPLLESEEYFIMLHKESALAKEVTTNDLSILQNHILGLKRFTSSFQYLAGDLNGDKKLDIEDMTLMRKLILNQDTGNAIPLNWIWLDKHFQFDSEMKNPLLQEWNTVQASILDMESLLLQLIGIKVGDIDASYEDD